MQEFIVIYCLYCVCVWHCGWCTRQHDADLARPSSDVHTPPFVKHL